MPANAAISLQPLDENGKALQLMRSWMTVMPGETVSCVGCHESPDSVPRSLGAFPLAAQSRPVRCLPSGGEMLYRAKNWCKWVNDENEERKRTVNSLNVLGRL